MLLWKNRLPKLRGKIHHSNADIVCLQEVSFKSFVDDFGAYFQSKHDYDYRLNQSPFKNERYRSYHSDHVQIE